MIKTVVCRKCGEVNREPFQIPKSIPLLLLLGCLLSVLMSFYELLRKGVTFDVIFFLVVCSLSLSISVWMINCIEIQKLRKELEEKKG